LHYKGAIPLHSIASYVSKVNKESCVGCETCVEICATRAIELVNGSAIVNEERCIGCGACVHLCPEKAIIFERTGPRNVYIPPPRLN